MNVDDSHLVTVTNCPVNSSSRLESQQETAQSIPPCPAEMSLIVDGLVNPDCLPCLREWIFSRYEDFSSQRELCVQLLRTRLNCPFPW